MIRIILVFTLLFVAIKGAEADELDHLIDNPSLYCQNRWLQVADALKGDAEALAQWRNQYAQVYADCMQDTRAEIAKRQKRPLQIDE